MENDAPAGQFGYCVAAGDVNGDGFQDVLVGARVYPKPYWRAGRALLFYGSRTGVDSTPAWTGDGTERAERFGEAVACADVDGDGFADVLVGSWMHRNRRGAVSFTVVATGTPPLNYQWRKDGQPLTGQTSATLTLANVQPSQAGSYTVVVSNSAGQVTSNPAMLTVTPAQAPRHPADVNPPDNRLTLQEVIAYAAAYKRGQAWPEGPNPIPLDYMIRAATLYKRGESYRHDPSAGGPPLWWINALSP